MEPELEPGFDLNYPVPLSKELPGFSGSGSEPGSITNYKQMVFQGVEFWEKLSNSIPYFQAAKQQPEIC